MGTLAVVAFQVTCVLVIGLVTARRLRHRAAALRHLVLLTTLTAAAVVPLVSPILQRGSKSPRYASMAVLPW